MPNQMLQPALPKPWLLNETIITVGTSATLVANTVYLIPVEVTGYCSCTGIRFRTTIATGTSDVGIYDVNGNLLGHSGATANAVATSTFNFTSAILLSPGRYILAITPSNSTDSYSTHSGNNAGLADAYTATNAASAGVLPNTTGGMAANGIKVQMVGLITGGAP